MFGGDGCAVLDLELERTTILSLIILTNPAVKLVDGDARWKIWGRRRRCREVDEAV
jgi:hypothetical protein